MVMGETVRRPSHRIGDRHERLVMLAWAPSRGGRRWMLMRCDCGTVLERRASAFTQVKSCGCAYRDSLPTRRVPRTHGLSKSSEARIWNGMKQRCMNPNNPAFRYYGGRGISVCERWLSSFVDFLADMGPRPSLAHSIDRINVNGNYEPGNCRWATDAEQGRNTTRVKLDEVSAMQIRWLTHETDIPKVEIASAFGISPSSVRFIQIGRNWSDSSAHADARSLKKAA